MPDGLALAETGWTSVQPYLSAASKVAPSAERVPRNAAGISLSRWKSRRRDSAMSVCTRLNVLVSCMKRAVRTRFAIVASSLGRGRFSVLPNRAAASRDSRGRRRNRSVAGHVPGSTRCDWKGTIMRPYFSAPCCRQRRFSRSAAAPIPCPSAAQPRFPEPTCRGGGGDQPDPGARGDGSRHRRAARQFGGDHDDDLGGAGLDDDLCADANRRDRPGGAAGTAPQQRDPPAGRRQHGDRRRQQRPGLLRAFPARRTDALPRGRLL